MTMKRIIQAVCLSVVSIGGLSAQQPTDTVYVDAAGGQYTISKHIYGHFSEHLGHCIYGGIWVGEDSDIPNTRGIRNDVVEALRRISIPNLRWPGGCFADEYHWRDGIGDRANRPKMINTHWGGVVEDNSFGTHEFLDLCEQLGCEPYICGNVGSGTVEEMSKWVEYITFDGESPMANLRKANGREKPWNVKFWGVGNENWGCGGNMTADFYADQYRRYATYCRNYGDNRLFKIAGGPNNDDYYWMETLMRNAHWLLDGVSLHYYTVPLDWSHKGSATQFDLGEYYSTISKALWMDELVTKHSAVMDKYDERKRIALIPDEWGAWYDVEPGTNPGFLYQQNTMRDAIVAAVTLNIFNSHCDRIRMANIAQMVNVLQSVILTDNERMLLTPTYWGYYLYRVHQEATMLPSRMKCHSRQVRGSDMPLISVSASRDGEGHVNLSLVNIDAEQSHAVDCLLEGITKKSKARAQLLGSDRVNDYNTFENPEVVTVRNLKDVKVADGCISVTLPPASVVLITIQ